MTKEEQLYDFLETEFKDGVRLYRESPMFHQLIDYIVQGASPWECLEIAVQSHDKMTKIAQDLSLFQPPAPIIIPRYPEYMKKDLDK